MTILLFVSYMIVYIFYLISLLLYFVWDFWCIEQPLLDFALHENKLSLLVPQVNLLHRFPDPLCGLDGSLSKMEEWPQLVQGHFYSNGMRRNLNVCDGHVGVWWTGRNELHPNYTTNRVTIRLRTTFWVCTGLHVSKEQVAGSINTNT